MPDITAYDIRISGLVQGVGYRYSVLGEARRLRLTGWVRNLPDGSVEVFAQGARDSLDTLVEFLRDGPHYARVRAVTAEESDPDPTLQGFDIRF